MGNANHTNAFIQIAWTVCSDIRDKKVFGAVPHGRDFLKGVNPIKYSFKDRETDEVTDETIRYGFSAQEIMELEGDEPVISNYMDGEEHLGFTHDYMIPVLVNAIKELDAEVTSLRQELNDLKNQNK
jgi:hypothetical protein